jgi:hypothetical protein
MNTFTLCFLSLLVAASGFADELTLKNQTAYPLKAKSKMAIQWASSGQEVDAGNQAIISQAKLDPNTLQPLSQSGQITLHVPAKAEYFRVLVWSNGAKEPDLLTNWVNIVPNKTYTLKTDHLVPSVLMLGTGC